MRKWITVNNSFGEAEYEVLDTELINLGASNFREMVSPNSYGQELFLAWRLAPGQSYSYIDAKLVVSQRSVDTQTVTQ